MSFYFPLLTTSDNLRFLKTLMSIETKFCMQRSSSAPWQFKISTHAISKIQLSSITITIFKCFAFSPQIFSTQAVALERDFDEPVEDTINPPEEIKELEPVILSFRVNRAIYLFFLTHN